MQREIQQITEGIVEYQKGYLEFSCQRIEISVRPDEIYEGTFEIKATSDTQADGDILTSDYRLHCNAEHFSGHDMIVSYTFDAHGLESEQSVTGNIILVSNLGEYHLPFAIQVEEEQVLSTLGDIKNLFHFANLAKSDWDEAVAMFYSADFKKIFKHNEKQFLSAYMGFSKMEGNESNVEEFLIEINKKQPIHYKIEEEEIHISDIAVKADFMLTISKSGWGYTELTVDAVGDFIQPEQVHLLRTDFQGNTCRLQFLVDATKLHAGVNLGKICVHNLSAKLEIPVIVEKHEGRERRTRQQEEKKCILELMSVYEEFQLKKFSADTWMRHSRRIINKLMELDPNSMMAQLMHIQLLITEDRFHEAEWYLKQITPQMEALKSEEVLYCYFLYLTTLYDRDEKYINMVTEVITRVYQKHQGVWQIAWLLLYLDEELTQDAQKKLEFLERQFALGSNSPILYLEALQIMMAKPSILQKLDVFEENVLWYAAKNKTLTSEVVDQILYLVERKKNFSKRIHQILVYAYETYEDSQILTILCGHLIKGNQIGEKFFPWYALGVEKNLRVTRLYDYYMMSMDLGYDGKIPKMVLMYFSYQADLDYEHTAFLYAYVLRNKEIYPEMERNYRVHMEHFVVDQVRAGRINRDLAYLYQNLISTKMFQDDLAYAFAPILFTNEVTIDNDEITNVVIIHGKVIGESSYPVENRRVYLPIYGAEYQILLQDSAGNRYTKSVTYRVNQLLKPDKLVSYITPYIEGRLGFDLYLCEANRNYVTITMDNVNRFKYLAESEQIEESYKKDIRTKLLHFYYDNDMIGELDSYLEEIEPEQMDAEERAEFVQFLISRGMFDKAYKWTFTYGFETVKLKSMARLISKSIMSSGFTYDAFLLAASYRIFQNKKYDENILRYLLQYEQGTIQHLRDIWKAADELDLDTYAFLEKMLQQMLFSRSFVGEKSEIFMKYNRFSERDEKLSYAFMTYCAYEYFVFDTAIEQPFIEAMTVKFLKEEKINVPCKLAMLKYFAQNAVEMQNVAKMIAPKLVNQFTRDEIYFSFYPKLMEFVPELEKFRDKQFVEYRAAPGNRILIRYIFESEDSESDYITEEMKDMYGGIHVKVFSLFYGEGVQYYIIEQDGECEQIVTSATIQNDGNTREELHTRVGMINDMVASMMHDDYQTVDQLLLDYGRTEYLTNELFSILN